MCQWILAQLLVLTALSALNCAMQTARLEVKRHASMWWLHGKRDGGLLGERLEVDVKSGPHWAWRCISGDTVTADHSWLR